MNKPEKNQSSTPVLDWFARQKKSQPTPVSKKQKNLLDGLWCKCQSCHTLTYKKDLQANQMVCLKCGHHHLIDSKQRIAQLIDSDTWIPLDESLQPTDPLQFRDQKSYRDRLQGYQTKTGLNDAVQTGIGSLNKLKVALGVMDFKFMGGSMGSVVGEKLTRLIERATAQQLPVIIVCASGGARMQEGMLSLMQMAKISGALQLHREAGLLYMSILTHPTMGGVTASFAMLGDIILAEPNALIGFAGRRVIEQTIREKLPDDFQTAEDLLHHGFIDEIVPRTQLKNTLFQLISFHQTGGNLLTLIEPLTVLRKDKTPEIQLANSVVFA